LTLQTTNELVADALNTHILRKIYDKTSGNSERLLCSTATQVLYEEDVFSLNDGEWQWNGEKWKEFQDVREVVDVAA
jgi:hypothetical protein